MSIAEDVRAAAAGLSGGGEKSPESSATPGVPVPPIGAGTGNRPPEPPGTTGTAPGRDAQGRFAPKQGDNPSAPAAPVPTKSDAQPSATPAAPRRGPPPAFRPTVHGEWDKVPPAWQDEIWRVEQSTRNLVQQSAAARKQQERFEQLVSGYKPYIQGDPYDWLNSLGQTYVRLQTAPKRDRAAVLAQMARQFDVDVDDLDGALHAVLSGQTQPQTPQRHEETNPLAGEIQQLRQQLQQMQLAPTLHAFQAKAEFLDEPMPGREDLKVRDMVAHHLRAAGQAGIDLSLEDAYAQVVAAHPTIQAVLKQREEAKAVADRQAVTARSEAASRSVRTEHVVAAPSAGSRGRTLDDVRASAEMLRKRG